MTLNPFRTRTIGRYASNGDGPRAWMELEPKMEPRTKRQAGSVLMWIAAIVTLALAAAQGWVSFRAQFQFVDSVKHAYLPSTLEALGLDTGAVIFALLALARARMGRPARAARALNVACAVGSLTMNLIATDLGSPRSIAVYAVPPLLYIAASDQLITTVRQAAGMKDSTVWRSVGSALLYALRACVALPSTASGLRRWLLQATPLPGPAAPAAAPAITAPEPPVPASDEAARPTVHPAQAIPARPRKRAQPRKGESKKAVLLGLYRDHPDAGNRARVSAVATELAPEAGLQASTARTYLYAEVDGASS